MSITATRKTPLFTGTIELPDNMPRRAEWTEERSPAFLLAMRVVYCQLVSQKNWVKTADYNDQYVFRERIEERVGRQITAKMRKEYLLKLHLQMVLSTIAGFLRKHRRLPSRKDKFTFYSYRNLILDTNVEMHYPCEVWSCPLKWELQV